MILSASAAMIGYVPEWVMLGVVGGQVGAVGLARLSRAWRQWRKGRQMDAAQPFSAAGQARGQLVQVRGAVERPARLLRTLKGKPAVLVRYHGCHGREAGPGAFSPWRWELHATDFCVRGADGREVWVDTRSILLLPNPPPLESRSLSMVSPLYVHFSPDENGPRSGSTMKRSSPQASKSRWSGGWISSPTRTPPPARTGSRGCGRSCAAPPAIRSWSAVSSRLHRRRPEPALRRSRRHGAGRAGLVSGVTRYRRSAMVPLPLSSSDRSRPARRAGYLGSIGAGRPTKRR